MKRNYEIWIGNFKKNIMERRVSFFSRDQYKDYLHGEDLNEGLRILLQLHPYPNLSEKMDGSLIDRVQEVANSYRKSNGLRRFWLRLTTSVRVYLDLADILMVSELECKMQHSSDLDAFEGTIESYKKYQDCLRPTWWRQLTNHWHHRLERLINKIERDWEFQRNNPPYHVTNNSSIVLLLDDINKALENKDLNLAEVVKQYQRFKAQYPNFNIENLKKLELRIALALHPDKNKQQEELATELFKEFYSIKNGSKIETNEGLSSSQGFEDFKAELDKQDEWIKRLIASSKKREEQCRIEEIRLEKMSARIKELVNDWDERIKIIENLIDNYSSSEIQLSYPDDTITLDNELTSDFDHIVHPTP